MKLRITLLLLGTLIFGIAQTHAATFDVVFTDSTYNVGSTDTFSQLLAAHNAATVISSTSVSVMDNIDTSIYAGGISGDYSVLMSTTINLGVAGSYEFQVGTDWGRGGGVALFDTSNLLQEFVTDTDIWWANNWGHSDVIKSTYSLSASEYTIMWLGFEGCCAGSSTVRFAVDGGPFAIFGAASIAPFLAPAPAAVPLPASGLLFTCSLLGLVGLHGRRASHKANA